MSLVHLVLHRCAARERVRTCLEDRIISAAQFNLAALVAQEYCPSARLSLLSFLGSEQPLRAPSCKTQREQITVEEKRHIEIDVVLYYSL